VPSGFSGCDESCATKPLMLSYALPGVVSTAAGEIYSIFIQCKKTDRIYVFRINYIQKFILNV